MVRAASLTSFFLLCLSVSAATGASAAVETVLEPTAVALEFDQRSWRHEHGLPPGDRVFALLQTRDGYLWIGTQYGLTRFDGRTFTVFDHVNTPELVSDDCRALAEDAEGNLWIGTKQGLVRKSGQRFTAMADKLGPEFALFPRVCASRSGGVWVGGPGRVCRIKGEVLTQYLQDKTIPLGEGRVTALVEDTAGFLWVGTETGFGRLDAERRQFEVGAAEPGLVQGGVLSLCVSARDELCVLFAETFPDGRTIPTTWLGSLKPGQWPKAPTVLEPPSTSRRYGRFMTADEGGTLWLAEGGGPGGGIKRYRNGNLEVLPVQVRVKDDLLWALLPDREGNLWIGTDNSGLQRWTPRKVRTYTTRDGLAHDNIWSICETSDGRVLLGTDGGITEFKEGRTRSLARGDGSMITDVRAVAEAPDGTIWAGTMRSLEYLRNGVSTSVDLPGEWFEAKIRALQPARDGSMWVGTVRGLTRWHKGERLKYTRADGLGSDEVRAILEDRSGDLWVGTLGGGLSRFREGQFTTLTTTNGLSSNNVWALHEDSEGVLWIGTDNGLSWLNRGRLTTCTRAQGLPDSLVNFIVSDDLGRLWVGHDRGVYTLRKPELMELALGKRATVSALSYDESDGFLSVETNGQKSYPAACRTRDGRLWIPTTQGAAVIEPRGIGGNDVAPLTAIEEIRANGTQVFATGPRTPNGSSFESSAGAEGFHFRPGGARVLEFDYTANTFVAPEKARFKYRLRGLDDHWIDAGTRRQAYFTDLRPGEYRFEVIAGNHRGMWQPQGATIAFHLLPFYYQTWWFYLACGAVAALAVGLGVAWRVRELRRIHELQRMSALNEQRRRIARDIHDELGASLTHIMRLSERVRSAPAPGAETELQAERITSIAGEAVDNIGEIVWANNPEYDTLEDLAAFLREHAAAFFADSRIQVRFDFPENAPALPVGGFFRRHVVLLMKEALQNVCKHADARHVNVRLSVGDEQLNLAIEDDGCGFDPEQARRHGNGLTNMRQRVSELKGTLEIRSGPSQGTKLRVVLPLGEVEVRGF